MRQGQALSFYGRSTAIAMVGICTEQHGALRGMVGEEKTLDALKRGGIGGLVGLWL